MKLTQHCKATILQFKKIKIPYDITCTWNLKYDTNEHVYETDTDSQIENRLVVAKGKGGGKGID